MKLERLEGRVSILAALQGRMRKFEVILVSEEAKEEKLAELLAAAGKLGVLVKRVPALALDSMCHAKTHGGVVATCTVREPTSLEEVLPPKLKAPLLLILEGVDDVRTLGYTLRTAEALGASALLLKKHVWDFDGCDLSRASSGAFERMPFVRLDGDDGLNEIRKSGVRIWGCIARVNRSIYDETVNLAGPVALAVGGEKRGLSAATRNLCDGFLRIPTREGAPSLSTGHAAAILLAEVVRRRAQGRGGG